MKTIKLKQKTIERLNGIEANVKSLELAKNNIFVTLLEDNEVDIEKYDVSYNDGVITLSDKEDKKPKK